MGKTSAWTRSIQSQNFDAEGTYNNCWPETIDTAASIIYTTTKPYPTRCDWLPRQKNKK